MDPHVKILEAAGITQFPYPLEVVPKILNDSLLQKRVLDHLVEMYAAEVLATGFHEAELKALRIRCRAESAKPKFRVSWSFISADFSQNAEPKIIAKSYIGENQAPDETFFWAPKTIEEARQIRFRGEAVPGDILYQYSAALNRPDPLYVSTQRDHELGVLAQKQKEANTLKGDLAVAVYSQPPVGRK
jgi:hypothetical protein